MRRKKQQKRLPALTPANPNVNDAFRSTPSDQPAQLYIHPLVSVVVLLVSIALVVWIGRDLYAIIIDGEICRPRCQSWSSHPVSLVVQTIGCVMLSTIFLGLAYCAVKFLVEPTSDDQA